jgi:multicomponent Na+:H+ antiporter subunit D
MSAEALIPMVLLAPMAQALAAALLARFSTARDAVVCLFAMGGAGAALLLAGQAPAWNGLQARLGDFGPGLTLAVMIEPLGAFMAALSATLAAMITVFSVGYHRASGQRGGDRRQLASGLALAAALSAILSANLATLFVAVMAMAAATSALIAVGAEGEARKGAQTTLAIMLSVAAGLLLPAAVALGAISDGAPLQPGGMFRSDAPPLAVAVLMVLTVFGIAASGLLPWSGWVGASAGAPAPVGALMHGAVVTPVGAFLTLKVCVYVFGDALQRDLLPGAAVELLPSDLLLGVSAASMLGLALAGLARQDLRMRLAYVCAAQAAGVVAAAAVTSPAGVLAAMFQLYALSGAACLAFMAAGSVRAATGRTGADEMAGIGRAMPWSMAGFAIAVVSVVGLAPFAGAWGKYWLIVAAVDATRAWFGVVVALAAVISFAALASVATRSFASPAPSDPFKRPDGASLLMVAPIFTAAVLLAALVFLVDPINAYFAPIWETP